MNKSRVQMLINDINIIGFQTGSSAFGVESESSDIDFVLPYKAFKELWEEYPDLIFYNRGYSDDDLFQNFFFNEGGKPKSGKLYDLIVPYKIEEYRVWKKATRMMKKIPISLYEDKEERVHLFEFLKSHYRKGGK